LLYIDFFQKLTIQEGGFHIKVVDLPTIRLANAVMVQRIFYFALGEKVFSKSSLTIENHKQAISP
jgi:hypothetical protein